MFGGYIGDIQKKQSKHSLKLVKNSLENSLNIFKNSLKHKLK